MKRLTNTTSGKALKVQGIYKKTVELVRLVLKNRYRSQETNVFAALDQGANTIVDRKTLETRGRRHEGGILTRPHVETVQKLSSRLP